MSNDLNSLRHFLNCFVRFDEYNLIKIVQLLRFYELIHSIMLICVKLFASSAIIYLTHIRCHCTLKLSFLEVLVFIEIATQCAGNFFISLIMSLQTYHSLIFITIILSIPCNDNEIDLFFTFIHGFMRSVILKMPH